MQQQVLIGMGGRGERNDFDLLVAVRKDMAALEPCEVQGLRSPGLGVWLEPVRACGKVLEVVPITGCA